VFRRYTRRYGPPPPTLAWPHFLLLVADADGAAALEALTIAAGMQAASLDGFDGSRVRERLQRLAE